MFLRKRLGALICTALLVFPGLASAAYTSLISAEDFTPITADVNIVAVGVVTIMVILAGLGLLLRALTR